MTMSKHSLWVGICFLIIGCASGSPAPEPLAEPGKPLAEPIKFTIAQRHTRSIAEYDDDLKIHIGDITRGQVLLNIWGDHYATILDTTSVTDGDVIKFDYKGQTLYLTVISLTNVLFGTDFGKFELSSTPPAERELSEGYRIIHFDYDNATSRGVISIDTHGKGMEAREWLVKNIGAICSSKNIVLKAGEDAEKGGHYRILDEKIKDDILTVNFEAAW